MSQLYYVVGTQNNFLNEIVFDEHQKHRLKLMGNNDNLTLQKINMDKTQIKQRFYNLPNSEYLLYNGQKPRPVTIVKYSADTDYTNNLLGCFFYSTILWISNV